MSAFIGPNLFLAALIALVSVGQGTRADEPAPKKPAEERIDGALQFQSRAAAFTGTDVGRAGNVRKYISGHPNSTERAVWGFDALPQGVKSAPDDVVPAKLTCAILYVKKTPPGVQVTVRVVSHTCPQVPDQLRAEWQWAGDKVDAQKKTPKEQYDEEVAAYRAKKVDPGAEKPDAASWKAANELAEKYGYYEVTVPKVFDFDEATIDLPAGLFRNALKHKPEAHANGTPKRPLVSVYVRCETIGVLIGMADADLYLTPKPAPKR